MIAITFQSIAGTYTGRSISWPPTETLPNGSRSKAAPRNRATTAKRPTMTDFLAWSFSSRARHKIIAISSAINRRVTPSGTCAAS